MYKRNFLDEGNVLYSDVLVVTNCMHLSIHRNVHLQKVNFTACKLYLNNPDLKADELTW